MHMIWKQKHCSPLQTRSSLWNGWMKGEKKNKKEKEKKKPMLIHTPPTQCGFLSRCKFRTILFLFILLNDNGNNNLRDYSLWHQLSLKLCNGIIANVHASNTLHLSHIWIPFWWCPCIKSAQISTRLIWKIPTTTITTKSTQIFLLLVLNSFLFFFLPVLIHSSHFMVFAFEIMRLFFRTHLPTTLVHNNYFQ